jgi:hypothetical protein
MRPPNPCGQRRTRASERVFERAWVAGCGPMGGESRWSVGRRKYGHGRPRVPRSATGHGKRCRARPASSVRHVSTLWMGVCEEIGRLRHSRRAVWADPGVSQTNVAPRNERHPVRLQEKTSRGSLTILVNTGLSGRP